MLVVFGHHGKTLTTSTGFPVGENQNSLSAGPHGPLLIQLRQIAHCFKADRAYGKGAAEGLGLSAEELTAVGA